MLCVNYFAMLCRRITWLRMVILIGLSVYRSIESTVVKQRIPRRLERHRPPLLQPPPQMRRARRWVILWPVPRRQHPPHVTIRISMNLVSVRQHNEVHATINYRWVQPMPRRLPWTEVPRRRCPWQAPASFPPPFCHRGPRQRWKINGQARRPLSDAV